MIQLILVKNAEVFKHKGSDINGIKTADKNCELEIKTAVTIGYPRLHPKTSPNTKYSIPNTKYKIQKTKMSKKPSVTTLGPRDASLRLPVPFRDGEDGVYLNCYCYCGVIFFSSLLYLSLNIAILIIIVIVIVTALFLLLLLLNIVIMCSIGWCSPQDG